MLRCLAGYEKEGHFDFGLKKLPQAKNCWRRGFYQRRTPIDKSW